MLLGNNTLFDSLFRQIFKTYNGKETWVAQKADATSQSNCILEVSLKSEAMEHANQGLLL
jgi:hypothetical protein